MPPLPSRQPPGAAPARPAPQGTADRLLAGRKLLLILDLDHTLLNSTRFVEVPPESEHVLGRAQGSPARARRAWLLTGGVGGQTAAARSHFGCWLARAGAGWAAVG